MRKTHFFTDAPPVTFYFIHLTHHPVAELGAHPDPGQGDGGDSCSGDESSNRYRLDPARFPKRLDLELSEPLLQRLEELAMRSGRSIDDVITEILSRQMEPPI